MIAANDIARVKYLVRIEDIIGQHVGLRRNGRVFKGLCPFHQERTPSFTVYPDTQSYYCFGCDAHGDIITWLTEHEGLTVREALEQVNSLTGERAVAIRRTAPVAMKHVFHDERFGLQRADAIWREGVHWRGTLGEEYLRKPQSDGGRAIQTNAIHDDADLRFHPECPWGQGTTPCLIARFTTAIGNRRLGIWRRPLTGEKPRTLGPMSGAVIRLWPDAAIERGLVIGEGVETVLAAATRITHRGALLQPAWAAGNAGNLAKFPVLPGVDALTLLVDNDASGTGQKAAAECALRWSEAGREVTRLMLNQVGADFNDAVRA